MSLTLPAANHSQRLASIFTLIAGLIQMMLALCILFLPVFTTCLWQPDETLDCYRETYLQQGGSLTGYALLLAMIGIGIAAIVSTRVTNHAQICRFRWVAVAVTACFVILGAWSLGLLFAPGGLLFLLAALSCRKHT